MNGNLTDILGGLFFLGLGVPAALFSRRWAVSTSDLYERLLGVRFSMTVGRVGFLLAGIAAAVYGFLLVVGVISFK